MVLVGTEERIAMVVLAVVRYIISFLCSFISICPYAFTYSGCYALWKIAEGRIEEIVDGRYFTSARC